MANTQNEQKKRLPIFERTKKIEKGRRLGFRFQERDLEILKLIYNYRFLDSGQIFSLIKGSNQGVLRRLQKLFHHGFLDRPIQQLTNWIYRTEGGTSKIIYALGYKGGKVLTEAYGLDAAKIDWTTKNREAGINYLNHSMMISNLRTYLTLALREKPGAKIAFWFQGDANEIRDSVQIPNKGKIPINPDAFFCLEDKNYRMYFFLEADQSTMTNQRFLRKMIGYWQYWNQEKHIKRFNINSFRVLTITKSKARAENLRKVTKAADNKKQGSVMFWFTSEDNYPEIPF